MAEGDDDGLRLGNLLGDYLKGAPTSEFHSLRPLNPLCG